MLSFLLMWSFSSGEEVNPYGNDRFITQESIRESSAVPEERILIRSSSNLSGKISILADDIESAVIEYRKIIKTNNRATASEFAEMTDVNVRKTSNGINILFQTPNPAPWSGTNEAVIIEGELRLPKDCRLKIDADYFDFNIKGPFVSVENGSSFGRWDVQNITRLLNLTGSNRSINLKNIGGDISVNLTHADIWIEKMVPENSPARIVNEYGNIYIDWFEGNFNINSSYGKIRLTDIYTKNGKSSINGIQCQIKAVFEGLNNVELFISDSHEDVILNFPDTVTASFFLKTELDGEVHFKGIEVKPILIESNYIELISGHNGSIVKVGVDGGGDIIIDGHPVATGK
jgi:hypothetical protein